MNPYLHLSGLGAVLLVVVATLGGRPAVVGGAVAVAAQIAVVALLRPAMQAAQPVFLARWLSGMGVRAVAAGGVVGFAATHRAFLPLLPTSLGFLAVLLPLMFLETRFLK